MTSRDAGPSGPAKGGLTAAVIAGLLGETDIFAGLGGEDREHLATVCLPRSYRRGEYLVHQGEPGDRLVVLARGRVKVVLTSPEGADMVLATLGRGETFGELAVFDGAPRSASVIALDDCVALSIRRSALMHMLAGRPAVLEAVLAHLAGTIRRLTTTAGDMVFLDLGGRLAKALLQLGADARGAQGPIPLTQSELAAAIGASRQATNRALHEMAVRGWISLHDGDVMVRDASALRKRAGLSPG